MKSIAIAFALSTATFAQSNGDANSCQLLLKDGLYSTFEIVKTGNFSSDLKKYFLSEQFKTDFQSNKWGATIDLIIDEVPVSLGANSSSDEQTKFKSKVQQAQSISFAKSFYERTYTSIPDIELAKTYSDCIYRNRKTGLMLEPRITDESAIFAISYNPISTTDPKPIIQAFEARNAGRIYKQFNIGDTLKNDILISCDRSPEKDIIFLLQTDHGTLSYVVPSTGSSQSKDLPVGTIISSYLDWTAFQALTKNNERNPNGNFWTSKYSRWAPADGRKVPNSHFASITSAEKIPNLQGVFIRGLNSFDPQSGNTVPAEQADPANSRSAGSFQSDEFKSHNHSATVNGSNYAYKTGGMGIQSNKGQEVQWGNPSVSIGNNGGDETRPKNISLFYYIKIN
jgi:hypothetical protein